MATKSVKSGILHLPLRASVSFVKGKAWDQHLSGDEKVQQDRDGQLGPFQRAGLMTLSI